MEGQRGDGLERKIFWGIDFGFLITRKKVLGRRHGSIVFGHILFRFKKLFGLDYAGPAPNATALPGAGGVPHASMSEVFSELPSKLMTMSQKIGNGTGSAKAGKSGAARRSCRNFAWVPHESRLPRSHCFLVFVFASVNPPKLHADSSVENLGRAGACARRHECCCGAFMEAAQVRADPCGKRQYSADCAVDLDSGGCRGGLECRGREFAHIGGAAQDRREQQGPKTREQEAVQGPSVRKKALAECYWPEVRWSTDRNPSDQRSHEKPIGPG